MRGGWGRFLGALWHEKIHAQIHHKIHPTFGGAFQGGSHRPVRGGLRKGPRESRVSRARRGEEGGGGQGGPKRPRQSRVGRPIGGLLSQGRGARGVRRGVPRDQGLLGEALVEEGVGGFLGGSLGGPHIETKLRTPSSSVVRVNMQSDNTVLYHYPKTSLVLWPPALHLLPIYISTCTYSRPSLGHRHTPPIAKTHTQIALETKTSTMLSDRDIVLCPPLEAPPSMPNIDKPCRSQLTSSKQHENTFYFFFRSQPKNSPKIRPADFSARDVHCKAPPSCFLRVPEGHRGESSTRRT